VTQKASDSDDPRAETLHIVNGHSLKKEVEKIVLSYFMETSIESSSLHMKVRLQHVPHEIVVVDDGSADATWTMLESLKARVPTLRPVQNPAPRGYS